VLGGSWGVTLALALAVAHPARVRALVLRAVCLMRQREVDHLFARSGGAAQCNPDGWKRFVEDAPAANETDETAGAEAEGDEDSLLRRYAHVLANSPREPEAAAAAARAFSAWEMQAGGLGASLGACPTPGGEQPSPSGSCWAWDGHRWTIRTPSAQTTSSDDGSEVVELSEADVRDTLVDSWMVRVEAEAAKRRGVAPDAKAAARAARTWAARKARRAQLKSPLSILTSGMRPEKVAPPGGAYVPAQAMLTSHYSVAHGFLDDGALLDGVEALRGRVQCVAVHGANDMLCPPRTVYELHERWPEMELRVLPGSGHSMYDAGLMREVLRATDDLREADDTAAHCSD
jgi:pimeloyl-ACP methyl ester carboxylesterase